MEIKFPLTLRLPISNFKIDHPVMYHNGVDLHIVGCGGTGSYFIQNICRVIKIRQQEYRIRVFLYDADTVEEKNLIRQNFSMKDIGKNKAEAMATKISAAYQISAYAYAKYIETPVDVENMVKASHDSCHIPIIVGCVDSMQCRKIIGETLKSLSDYSMWIDSGNEEFFGQVIVATYSDTPMERMYSNKWRNGFFTTPSFIDLYPQLFEGNLQKTSEISCAEHALDNIQNIGANIFSSTMLFMVLNNLLSGDGISSAMINFDAKVMRAQNTPIIQN